MTLPWSRRALAALALVLACTAAPARAVDVPPGFTVDRVTPNDTFELPTALAFLPGGRLLVAEKKGVLWSLTNGVKASTPMWDRQSEVLSDNDRGLLGLAVDPNYVSNRFVYLMYTVDPDSNGVDNNPEAFGRLVRYQVSASDSNLLDPASRTILFGSSWANGPLIASPSHTVACLRWGIDGSLLVSTGDGANFDVADHGGIYPDAFLPGRTPAAEDIGAYRSQFVHSLCGKILRIDPETGHGYPSNPFYDGDATSVRSRVFMSGLRNPFRFVVRPGTGSTNPANGQPGHLVIGDVGWTTWEEFNVGTAAGKDFGWPCYEGALPTRDYSALPQSQRWLCDSLGTAANPATEFTFPIIISHHGSTSQSSPPGFLGNTSVAGAFYTAVSYPAIYQGKAFLMDFSQSWIKVADIDASGGLVGLQDFASDATGPSDMAVHPTNGDLYYLALYVGQLRRIRYEGGGGNPNPVAVASATPNVGIVPLNVQFSSAGSYDPGGATLTYGWNFGDQSGSTAQNPSHTYLLPGNYTVVLTVDNGLAGVASDSLIVTVGATAQFPTTGILDNFNRPDGPIGGAWTGDVAGLQISSGAVTQISLTSSGVLTTPVLGPTQEAYVSFQATTPNAPEHNLMLKVQGMQWFTGHIEVHYDGPGHNVTVNTYSPQQSWVNRGGPFPTTLQTGDQFGARAYENGTVIVYQNGLAIGEADCSGWNFAANGGRVGMTLTGAYSSRLDDFGGGDAVLDTNTAPTIAITSPGDSTFYVAGDTIQLACSASDEEQPANTLAYRWDVDLRHNNHTHPSVHVFTTDSAEFIAENHDDGTGISFVIKARATDSGNLADTVQVRIFPEVNLSTSEIYPDQNPANDAQTVEFGFYLRNLGRMPAPFSRWRFLVDGAMVAQGDTTVAALDSIRIVVNTETPLAAGQHVVRVVADTLGAVYETDEADNARTMTLLSVGVLDAGSVPPQRLELSNPYPNPGRGPIAITLSLPRAAPVSFSVLDVQGRVVWSAPVSRFDAGQWPLRWDGRTGDGSRAPAGLYLARVRVEGRDFTRRLMRMP